MNKLPVIILIALLIGGCSRSASDPQPTQPILNFPTTEAGELPSCGQNDLTTSANSTGASGSVTLGITLTNKSKFTCTLANPPRVELFYLNNIPFDAESKELPAAQTPPSPAFLQIAPQESAIVTLIWRNFCKTLPGDNLTIRMMLTDNQKIDVVLKVTAVPGCDANTEPSSIIIGDYSTPP